MSQSEDGIKIKKASPINWTKQSQAKRVREAHKKCLELMGKLFARREIKRQYCNDEIEFLPMQSFMGRPFKKDNTWTRELSGYGAKFNPWDFEANVQRIIEHYLKGFPKKTHFYLLKHPSFVLTKEAWKDEMACYWMLANIGNDHPYLDMSCDLETKSGCNYRDINHDSRGGPWSHGPWFFAHLRLFSDDPYRKLWQLEALAALIEIEQKSGYAKGKGVSIMAYAWDLPDQESNKEWIVQRMHADTGIPIEDLRVLSFDDFEKVRKYKEDSWKKNLDATKV